MVAKLKDMVSLSFLVYAQDIPSVVRMKDHSLGFVGADASSSLAGFITGVYGTHSKQLALVLSAQWSKARLDHAGLNRVLMLDVNYRVDNYALTREQTRRDTLDQTGWLHMDRISSGFREEIKESWMEWINKDFGSDAMNRASEESLSDIALQYPKYVSAMLKEDSSIRGIVHPVNPTLNPTVCLWAATVRYDKARFDGALMRYLPQVKVVL